MALTNVEENQVRELLTVKEELLDLGADSSSILAEIGGTDTTVPLLTAATALVDTDLTYLAQGANDRKVTLGQIKTHVIAPHEAAADPHPQYLTQAEGDARYAQALTGQFLNRVILTAASGSWVVPVGVKEIFAYALGKGANGGSGSSGVSGGNGGAGGGAAWGKITVTAGQTLNYTIDSSSTTLVLYLNATAGIGADAPGGGFATPAVTSSGTASGGTGGYGFAGVQGGGGGGGSSGSPLGTGGAGAAGAPTEGGGGGGWGGAGFGFYGGGGGGAANAQGPGAAGGVMNATGTYAPGRTQFTRYSDLLLAPCDSALSRVGAGNDVVPMGGNGGTGGNQVAHPTYGGGAGGCNAASVSPRNSIFGGGAGGGAVTIAGGAAGFGGGGGGGTANGGTAGGAGGAGCICIFY